MFPKRFSKSGQAIDHWMHFMFMSTPHPHSIQQCQPLLDLETKSHFKRLYSLLPSLLPALHLQVTSLTTALFRWFKQHIQSNFHHSPNLPPSSSTLSVLRKHWMFALPIWRHRYSAVLQRRTHKLLADFMIIVSRPSTFSCSHSHIIFKVSWKLL